MPRSFEDIVAAKLRGQIGVVTQTVEQLPPGYQAGGRVYMKDDNFLVDPFVMNIRGRMVRQKDQILISGDYWNTLRVPSNFYFLYVSEDREWFVSPTRPEFNSTLFAYQHPSSGDRLLGVGYVDSSRTLVYASSLLAFDARSVRIAATDYGGVDYDYICDGTADEVEINNAISYLSEAFGGGVVTMLPGTFTLAAAIVLKSNITLSGSGRGTVLQPGAAIGAITVTGTDGNEILGAGIRDFKIKRTAFVTDWVEDVNLDYADRFFANAVEFDADAAVASPDPGEHTVISAENCDDLLVTLCDLRMAGYGISASYCSGKILSNTISMSAPADKQYTIGVRVGDSPRFLVSGNTISNLLNSRPGFINLKGVYVYGSKNSAIKDNTVENIRAVAQTDASSSSNGISTSGAWGGSAAEITGNLIRDVHDWHAGEFGGAPGILIHSNTDDVSIAGNHIEHADTGIRIDHSSCERTIVSGNFVTNCGQLISDGNCEDANAPMVLGETVPYSAGTGGSYARSAVQAYEGNYSYLLTGDGVDICFRDFMDSNNTAEMHGLLAGVEYTFEVWVYVVAPLLASEVQFQIYDYYGGWASTSASPVGQDAWEKVTVTRRLRVGATGTTIRFILNTGHSLNEEAYIDNVRLFPTNHQNAHENCLDDNGTDTRF